MKYRLYHSGLDRRGPMIAVKVFEDDSFQIGKATWADVENCGKGLLDVGEFESRLSYFCQNYLLGALDPGKKYPNKSFGIPVSYRDYHKCVFGSRSKFIAIHRELMKIIIPDLSPYCNKCDVKCCTQAFSKQDYVTNLRPEEFALFKDVSEERPIYYGDGKSYNRWAYNVDGKFRVLKFDEKGNCPLYIDGKCSVHDKKPLGCQQFICHKLFKDVDAVGVNQSQHKAYKKIIKPSLGTVDVTAFVKDYVKYVGSCADADLLESLTDFFDFFEQGCVSLTNCYEPRIEYYKGIDSFVEALSSKGSNELRKTLRKAAAEAMGIT